MGSGQHNGSAPGKNICVLAHSSTCKGGIGEDEKWRACPTGYTPGMVMSETGFEHTLQYTDFTPGVNPDQGSTPIVPRSGSVQLPLLAGQGDDGDDEVGDLVRFQLQANGEGARSKVIKERFPGMFYTESPAVDTQSDCLPPTGSFPAGSGLHEDVAALRATNQQQVQQSIGSSDLTIAGIRQTVGMRDDVEQQMSYFRDMIPAWSAAPSAPAPGLQLHGQLSLAAEQQGLPPSVSECRVGSGAYNFTSAQLPTSNQPDQNVASHEMLAAQKQYEGILKEQALANEELNRLRAAQQQQAAGAASLLHLQQAQAAREAAVRQQKEQLAAQQQAAALLEQKQRVTQATNQLQATQAALRRQKQQYQNASVLTHGNYYTQAAGNIPTRTAPVLGVQQSNSEYEYFVGADGGMCRGLKTPAPAPAVVHKPTHWENRWSPTTGRLYQVQVPATPPVGMPAPPHHQATPAIQPPIWRFDPITGQPYQSAPNVSLHNQQQSVFPQSVTHPPRTTQLPSVSPQQLYQQQIAGAVNLSQSVIHPSHTTQLHSVSPHQLHQQHQRQIAETANLSHSVPADDSSMSGQIREKLQGIVSMVEKGDSLKKMKLNDYVKRCPAKWSKDVTSENMNLPVYAYGTTSELVASLSGRAEPLPEAVLLAKLQHMQNVFEICCQNSTLQEYNNYGWVLARDYASKVQNKVDQKLMDWGTMSAGVQTADLVSAQFEFPRPALPKKDLKDDKKDKTICTTFNTCTTEKKCDYEVANPGRTCLRKHECSHCRKHLNRGNKHQVWKCPNKSDK